MGLHDKNQIADALRETGQLLKVKGENRFKVNAYFTAARAIQATPEDIGDLVREERLTEIPGIGPALSGFIVELYTNGESQLLARLQNETPPGTAELSRIQGMTLKRIQILSKELNIKSISDLEDACRQGRIALVKGFSTKTQDEILKAIAKGSDEPNQIRLIDAFEVAEELVNFLKASPRIRKVEIAGSIRRWHEAVDEVTLVAEADKAHLAKVMKNFHGAISIKETESAVIAILSNGISAEVFPITNIALGLVAKTGTAEHFSLLQQAALQKGLELSTNILRRGKQKLDCHRETDVFKAIGLHYIPAEIREGEDEVKLAEKSDFSDLVDLGDIRGMVHCHTTYSDGIHSIEEMARTAQKMGMEYITITDHSPTAHYAGGLDVGRLREQWAEIDQLQKTLDIKIMKGTECDILADGKLDYPDNILSKFDVIIASIHSRYRQDEEAMTKRLLKGLRNPHFKIWGHPLGRLVLKRDPIPCNVAKLLEAIAEANVAIEINGDPYRLDMPPNWAKVARQCGLKFVISTDAHARGAFHYLTYGIHMARRARIRKNDVLNTLSVGLFSQSVRTDKTSL